MSAETVYETTRAIKNAAPAATPPVNMIWICVDHNKAVTADMRLLMSVIVSTTSHFECCKMAYD